MNTFLTVLSLVFGVIGIVLAVLFARRSERLNRERRRLEWPDIQAAASDLARQITGDFQPEAIITPGLSGATFANLLVENIKPQPPVFVGLRFWKEYGDTPPDVGGYDTIETNKWHVMIPEALFQSFKGPLLVVDDFALSGDFLDNLRAKLEEHGRKPEDIKSATIAVTNVAIKNHKAPDYFWWKADDDNFYFPWGRAR